MTTRRGFLASGILLPLALVACGGDDASGAEPPDIKLGRDTCNSCRMIISEERFASGLVDGDGKASIYDDVGEMVHAVQQEGLNDRKVWVHGYPSLEWKDGTGLWYVVTTEFPTPMGSGVVPFDSESEAKAFATEKSGTVYTWTDLLAQWSFDAMA